MIKNKRAKRGQLKKEQRKRCYYCGSVLSGMSHIDHIIPQCSGGPDDIDNLCLACPRCNTYKSGYSIRRWLRKLEARKKTGQYVNWKKWDDQERINVIVKLTSLTTKKVPAKQKDRDDSPIKPSTPSTIHNLMKGLSGGSEQADRKEKNIELEEKLFIVDEKVTEWLSQAGIDTMDRLLEMDESDLRETPGIGFKRIGKIRRALEAQGLSLKPTTAATMLSIYLRENRCTGLEHPDCETGCRVKNLAPCGHIRPDCRAVPWRYTHTKGE